MHEPPLRTNAPHLGKADYQALFEGANDAILVFDPESEKVLLANQRAGELYGLPVDRLIGLSIKTISKNIEQGRVRVRETMNRGLYHRFETVQIRSDGSEVILEVTASVVEFAGKKAILSINRDITERKQAEDSLRESREREALIARSLPAAVYLAPLGDSADTSWIGPGVKKISGFEPHRFIEEPFFWRNRIHPEDRDRVLAAFSESPLDGIVEVEYRWLNADGAYRWFFDTATVREGENGNREILGTILDVTAQHEIQQQLLHAQKMEAIGRLVGGLAHDFNNLLQGMLGTTLLCRIEQEDHLQVEKRLQELEAFIQQGSQLTRRLLLFSRKEIPITKRVDLRILVKDTLGLVQRLMRANIQVEQELGDQPIWVDVDRGQMQQVIMNLAINAADAMPTGGTLRIATGFSGQKNAWIEVTDTGQGIAKAIQPRVFEPFFTTKPAGQGTGLGLSVVQGIVSDHGGVIDLTSVVEQGSTFRITLPQIAAPETESSVKDGQPATNRGKGETILLVEDSETVCKVVTEMLKHLGYQILTAGSAEEALTLSRDRPFDALLTDFMLPGMSGRNLAVELRRDRPDLPVLLMSGYATEDFFTAAEAVPGLVVLHKPVQLAVLATEMSRALSN